MDSSHDENFALSDHLGELVISPTSYTSKFFSIQPNEVWVKGFFFMAPHEEYGTPRLNFYDEMVGAHYYSHLKQNPLLLYDDANLHGCTYGMHLSHLKTHGFSCSTLGSFGARGTIQHWGE